MHMHLSLIGRIAKGANVRAVKCCLWYATIRKSPSLPYCAFLTLLPILIVDHPAWYHRISAMVNKVTSMSFWSASPGWILGIIPGQFQANRGGSSFQVSLNWPIVCIQLLRLCKSLHLHFMRMLRGCRHLLLNVIIKFWGLGTPSSCITNCLQG